MKSTTISFKSFAATTLAFAFTVASAIGLTAGRVEAQAAPWNKVTNTTIKSFTTLGNGEFYIETEDPICEVSSNTRVGLVRTGTYSLRGGQVTMNDIGRESLRSLATAAILSGRRVIVYADDNSSASNFGCHLGAIKML